jgi:hypothetical protein
MLKNFLRLPGLGTNPYSFDSSLFSHQLPCGPQRLQSEPYWLHSESKRQSLVTRMSATAVDVVVEAEAAPSDW